MVEVVEAAAVAAVDATATTARADTTAEVVEVVAAVADALVVAVTAAGVVAADVAALTVPAIAKIDKILNPAKTAIRCRSLQGRACSKCTPTVTVFSATHEPTLRVSAPIHLCLAR